VRARQWLAQLYAQVQKGSKNSLLSFYPISEHSESYRSVESSGIGTLFIKKKETSFTVILSLRRISGIGTLPIKKKNIRLLSFFIKQQKTTKY